MLYLDKEGDPQLLLLISDHLGRCPDRAEWFARQQRLEDAVRGCLAKGDRTPALWGRIAREALLPPEGKAVIEPEDNLLVRLDRWVRRQGENFLTEAFAHQLRHLLRHEPEAAVRLLKALRIDVDPGDARSVRVTTQVTVTRGRPDLEFRASDLLAYVEAKVGGTAGLGQLRRYRQELADSGVPRTRLVLLTRYAVALPEVLSDVCCMQWHQVAECLEEELSGASLKQPISVYLVQQFIGLLRARNMTVDRVGPELVRGLHALMSLRTMLREALAAHGLKGKQAKSAKRMGYNWEGIRYFLGLEYIRPQVLVFIVKGVDGEAAKQLAVGRVVVVRKKGVAEHRWWSELPLNPDAGDFLNLPKADQQRRLADFVTSSLSAAGQILPKG
jgi:hypothetical protein